MNYKAVPHNPNLKLFTQSTYKGLPVNASPEYPCIYEYLEKSWQVISRAKKEYNRLYAVRIDLHYPAGVLASGAEDNQVMERFKKAIESRMQACSNRKLIEGKRVHPCRVRLIWAREQDSSINPHYHVVLLLNRDRYFRLGEYDPNSDNLFSLVHAAWSSAIKRQTGGIKGVIHIPQNAEYYLNSNDGFAAEAKLFQRISYLCKLRTKLFGQYYHGFGVSRQ